MLWLTRLGNQDEYRSGTLLNVAQAHAVHGDVMLRVRGDADRDRSRQLVAVTLCRLPCYQKQQGEDGDENDTDTREQQAEPSHGSVFRCKGVPHEIVIISGNLAPGYSMRSLQDLGNPYQHAPEVSIVRSDTCNGFDPFQSLARETKQLRQKPAPN